MKNPIPKLLNKAKLFFRSASYIELFFSLALPLTVGCFSALMVAKYGSFTNFTYIPSFMPAKWIHVLVWTVIYLIMGFTFYITNYHFEKDCKQANNIYFYNLILGFLFIIVFFMFKWMFIGALFCLYLSLISIQLMSSLGEIKKLLALIVLPYPLWMIFSTILAFDVWWLNW